MRFENQRPESRPALSPQSGQTTVFLALAMMLLICFLAFMVDVGQLVHDKILTQSVADMVALSGANVQAAGMNELADLNWEYWWLQWDLRFKWLPPFTYADMGSLKTQISIFKMYMGFVYAEMQITNRLIPALSIVAAFRTLEWYNDKYGGFRIDFLLPSPPGGLTSLEHTQQVPLISTYAVQTGINPLPAWVPTGFRPIAVAPVVVTGVPAGYVEMLQETYMRKTDNAGLTSFVALVSRERRPVFVNLPHMGYDVEIPRIYAASGLIPTGGDIEKGRPNYFARFVPLEELGYPGFKH